MSAMFPSSGVPSSDAKNSLPDPTTMNCQELWYSTSRCQPRFDPASANAVISELVNIINKGEVTYDCSYLDNAERAIRYMIQRGLPISGLTVGGPTAYQLALDPPPTRYNNNMTIVVVPNVGNVGAVTIDINGLGSVPILRHDGLALGAGDFPQARPVNISYSSGAFYMTYPVKSEIMQWINDAIANAISALGRQMVHFGYAYKQGAENSYLVTCQPPISANVTAYEDFLTIVVIPVGTNDGPVTLNVNNLGPQALIRDDGAPLEANDFKANVPYIVSYSQGTPPTYTPPNPPVGGGGDGGESGLDQLCGPFHPSRGSFSGPTAGGPQWYTLTPSPALTREYVTGDQFHITMNVTNILQPVLAVTPYWSTKLCRHGAPNDTITAGELQAGRTYTFQYCAGNFYILDGSQAP